VVNWLIKPFTMALVGWLFFPCVFRSVGRSAIGAGIHRRYDFIGRCTLHGNGVRVVATGKGRSELHAGAGVGERHHYDFCLRSDCRRAAWRERYYYPLATLVYSTVLYVLLPLIAGWLTRKILLKNNRSIAAFTAKLKPFSIVGLLLTVVLLFAFKPKRFWTNLW
ncbi:hypothetical protein, partial [Moraxella caviae]|uniref:hypothetical protein n=1 Tax=Moraxella caviae TaxID=34060 RepID=UPI001F5E81C1